MYVRAQHLRTHYQGARAKGRGGTSVLYEVDEFSQMDEEDENATDDEENAEHQVFSVPNVMYLTYLI